MFWKIKMHHYEILVPPLGKPVHKLTKAEARAYFDWYTGHIPGRVLYLQQQSGIRLNGTEESLVHLWRWFLKNAEIDKASVAEQQALKERASSLGPSLAETVVEQNTWTLSLKTKYILQDISMYWGEVFIKNHPSISWAINANSDSFKNQPVLVGFVNDVFPDKPGIPFPPYHMAMVQASKLLRGKADKGDLLKIHRIWTEKIVDQK